MSDAASVGGRLASIVDRIASACRRSGRRESEVLLVGASKSQPLERLQQAWAAGLTRFGENRVQEAEAKRAGMPAETEWHLFGPLQSNKARKAAALFRVVHSVDRPKIARALDREAERRGVVIEGFLEVNLGSEPTKHGFAPAGFAAAVEPLAELEHLRLVGLMAIPPLAADDEAARRWFRELRRMRDELFARSEWAGRPGLLSMGMSDDFEIAIEEGATHVRVGSALFGPRA